MRRLTSLLAALLLGSVAGVVAAVGPAAAAACPQGQGVTVVVGSSISCDANGGGSAADNFSDAGYTLTRVDRQPGFVCQVNGEPASASCVNTPPSNAYWGLFWSDGTSGTWKYASQGAYSLSVPAGGWVGFRFQDSNTRTVPGVTPGGPAPKPTTKPTVKPKATPKPTAKPAAKPSAKPTAKAVAPSAKPSASASAPTPAASASPIPSATTPTPAVTPTESPADDETTASPDDAETSETTDTSSAANSSDSSDGSGSLGLVAGALVLALIGGMGAVLWRRKAAGGSS